MMLSRLVLALVAPATLLNVAGAPASAAEDCSPRVVQAQGEVNEGLPGIAGVEVVADRALASLMLDYSEQDLTRLGLDDDFDEGNFRLSLLGQVSGAIRYARGNSCEAAALVEYYARDKRGNPRRTKVQVTPTDMGVYLSLAA